MSSRTTRVRLLVIAWLLLVGGAVAVGVTGMQNDLGPKAEAALSAAGIDAAVDVSGRDVTITGSSSDRTQAESVVSGVNGVRAVHWEDATGSAAPDTPASTTTTEPPQASTTQATPSSSTLPPITDEPDEAAENSSRLEARLAGGAMTIRGTIPSPEAAAALEFVADLIYSPLLDNQLQVDPEAVPASWVPRVADAIAVLPIVGTSGLTIVGEEATLFGYAPTEERLAQLEGALAQALGPDINLNSEVEVTGLAPPTIVADVPGNGIITVSGTVPSQEIVDFAMGLAVNSYGAENVINEMEIDPGVDTTFSLFRLPLVFPAFEPFPEWHVEIYDNVISGQLLNGASFPSGSAELTPQLLQLMPVGTGILTRNPTLVITVEGHTDDIGSEESNLALSIARAESAKEWFVESGIDPARVFAVGYGETRPIADNTTAAGRAQNRRIEFRLGPPE